MHLKFLTKTYLYLDFVCPFYPSMISCGIILMWIFIYYCRSIGALKFKNIISTVIMFSLAQDITLLEIIYFVVISTIFVNTSTG